jgi:probable HAF family extracellular repeat protein
MVDLGTLGGTHSEARAVNATGQVIGWSFLPGDTLVHAFSWTQAGGMVDLGTLGGTASDALAVNATGQVVGSSALPGDTSRHAFSWTQGGGMIDLGTLGGRDSGAVAVNATGQVVGSISRIPNDFAEHAVLWQVGVENSPPRCDLGQAVPNRLWPPNHKLVPVRIAGVTDPEGSPVTITITGVTQDEPVNGRGDGDTSPDALLQGVSVLLRAERSGSGNGREYRVEFTAEDGDGGVCAGAVSVVVPHN